MHTIHNIAFEVDVNYDNSLVSWEQYYVDFFQERLMPSVERMCDDWDKKHPNKRCVIDAIDINVEVNSLNLEALQKEIIQQINTQLNDIRPDGSNNEGTVVATISKEASPFDALIRYLSDGILPSHISVKVFKEWLGAIVDFTLVEKNALTSLFSAKTEAVERMVSLLRNDYEKFSKIIASKQQITSQFITLEATFFQQFLKVLCTQFKLTFKTEEASIWHKTLGFSSSLPQFSKTLLQLLTPKAQAENKRLTKIDETQLSIALIQAITQYELNKSIAIKASKIATIIKDDTAKSQGANVQTLKKSIKNTSEDKNTKEADKQSQKAATSKQIKNKNKVEKVDSEKFQTTKQQNNKLSKEKAKQSKINGDSSENISKATVSNLAEANTKNKIDNTVITKQSLEKDIDLTTEKAGLILLHPFLIRFFDGIGLLTENNEINDIGKACMLLHYLATETEDVTDVELTLEKVLLGIPLHTIVNYQTPLTKADKELCEELLRAVLEHWVVLKKSTINTLRDMFLKRDGELTLTQNSIKLKIERTAQDILLEKVPWNISLIRLKWMGKMMHVEW
ncbi:contractile injection system tape measure protein [Kordia sp.]|uniref:contractile injection system tape measure protein n=1 Tax=Kordia sp. TaxID=1965332 RepID=UPI003D6C05BD